MKKFNIQLKQNLVSTFHLGKIIALSLMCVLLARNVEASRKPSYVLDVYGTNQISAEAVDEKFNKELRIMSRSQLSPNYCSSKTISKKSDNALKKMTLGLKEMG